MTPTRAMGLDEERYESLRERSIAVRPLAGRRRATADEIAALLRAPR